MTGRNARKFGLGRIAGQRKAETPENSAWAEFFGRRKAEMPGRKAREFGLGPRSRREKAEKPWRFGLGNSAWAEIPRSGRISWAELPSI
jgi:hypothetical protein